MLLSLLLLLGATAPVELPAFHGESALLDDAVRSEMKGVSWREGCPVPLDELRLLTLTYIGNDGQAHQGELVVHAAIADEMLELFAALYAARFPIEKMERIERYAGDDDASMTANNTSAFNCRRSADNPKVFSRHAYGLAIDVNPKVNPFVKGERVEPEAGRPYLDRRTDLAPGMIRRDDDVVRVFLQRGYRWGGSWRSLKDYQHFDKDPRAVLPAYRKARSAKRPSSAEANRPR